MILICQTNELITIEKQDFVTTLLYARNWERFTESFTNYFYTDITHKVEGYTLILDYDILSKKNEWVYTDVVKINLKPIKVIDPKRKRNTVIMIIISAGLGILTGYGLSQL